jgi:hypothetical protein
MLGTNSHSLRSGRRAGVLISTPFESDATQHRDLVQCVHCQFTTVWTPGSGRYWGWCARCNGFYCGWKPTCHQCVPALQMIENLEAGMPYELAIRHRPIRISTAGLLLPGG